MRRKNRGCAGRNLGGVLDEHSPTRAQVVDDSLVVDDLVADVYGPLVIGRAVIERQLDGANGALDASAESARRSQQDRKRHHVHLRLSANSTTTFTSAA